MIRGLLFTLSIPALFLFCLSCSRSDDSPTSPGGGSGPVTKTIAPTGGTISARANGATVTLTFPAGAVRGPLDVTLSPVAATSGALFGMQLEPLGFVFEEPVAIEVELPSGANMTDLYLSLGDGGDPWYLPTERDEPMRTIRTSLNFFGLEDGYPMGAATAKAPASGNQLGTAAVDCNAIIATLKTRFDFYVASGDFVEAVQLAKNIAAVLFSNGCADGVSDWIDIAENTACDGLAAASTAALATPIDDYGGFVEAVSPMIQLTGLIQELNPESGCTASTDAENAIDVMIADFITFFNQRMDAIDAWDWGAFLDVKAEALSTYRLRGAAQVLNAFDAAEAINDKAFRPAVDRLRQAAYIFCQEDGWHYPLSRMTSTGFFAGRDIVSRPPEFGVGAANPYADFTDDEIFDDLQYCGSGVELSSVVASGGQLASGFIGGGGAPGQRTRDIFIDTPTRGKLRLQNRLNAFTCWNDIEADHEIAVRINARDVFILPRPSGGDDYLGNAALDIEIATIAERAGITPKEGTSQFMTVMRRRNECEPKMWGPAEYVLFELTLNWKNPTLEVEVDLPPTVQAGETVDVDVRVKVIDQLGQDGFFDAIDVVLQAAGGTLQQLTGQTDAAGYFKTRVTVDGSQPLLDAFGKAVPMLQIGAAATSFEGVNAQGVGSAVISGPRAVFELAYHQIVATVEAAGGNGGGGCEPAVECRSMDPFEQFSADWDFAGSGTANASCGGANATGSASVSGITDANAGVFARIDANVSANGTAVADNSYVSRFSRTASATANWVFNVLEGDLNYSLTGSGSVNGSPVVSSLLMELVELNDNNSVRRILHRFSPEQDPSWTMTWSEVGTLSPGRYRITVATNAAPSANCNDNGQFQNGAGNFSFSLSVP